MRRHILTGLTMVALAIAGNVRAKTTGATDIDPDALAVLKQATDTIKNAKAFSFRARTARDRLATNGQLLTYFQDSRITVSRPDKLRVDIDGEHHDVVFLFNAGAATLFQPKQELYTSLSAPKTIDQMLATLEKIGIVFPTSNLFRSDPYPSLIDGLETAYVVGKVNMFGKEFVHLAFTEADADWQLWVELGDKPLPRRFEIVYKKDPGSPRIAADLSDWDLSANPAPDLFTFHKPAGAHQIELLKTIEEK
jgi:hypothetical protein